MATEQWLDFLGISMDSRKAEGMHWTVNLVTPDNGEKFLIEMSNATLTNIKGFTKLNAELTVTVNRSDLNQVMVGAKSFEQLEADGKARFEGDRRPFNELRSILTVFTPDFEIFPGNRQCSPGSDQREAVSIRLRSDVCSGIGGFGKAYRNRSRYPSVQTG